ncbi:MAG TPA: hypothetical protein VGH28_14045 [Polyangiaceae bacterium]|jgi:hypothetical protein
MSLSRASVGPQFNEGSRLLWVRLREMKLSFFAGAKRADIDRTQFYRFAYGDRVPSMADGAKMRDAFNIAIDAWSQKPTASFALVDAQREHAEAMTQETTAPTGTHDEG